MKCSVFIYILHQADGCKTIAVTASEFYEMSQFHTFAKGNGHRKQRHVLTPSRDTREAERERERERRDK